MSAGWAIFVIVAIVGIAACYFAIGVAVGADSVSARAEEKHRRLMEAERMLYEIDRAAFVAMLGQVEGSDEPRRRRELPARWDPEESC